MNKQCKNCGYKFNGKTQTGQDVLGCMLTQQVVEWQNSCSNWNMTATKCSVCGRPIPKKGAIITKDSAAAYDNNSTGYNYVCEQCTLILRKCNTCSNVNFCEFNTNQSPLPKFVMATSQQGNVTQRMQIKNPDRVNMTCKVDCNCWNDTEQICMKDYSEGCTCWSR